MDRLIGFVILFPLVVIIAVIAAFLSEEVKSFSGALILVTGAYVYALSERIGRKIMEVFKEKLFRKYIYVRVCI